MYAEFLTTRVVNVNLVAVADMDNRTDEFIPLTSDDFTLRVKAGLDNKKDLIEVILKDDGIYDFRDRSFSYEYFRSNKELHLNFEHNIRFLLIPRIASVRINRNGPTLTTRNVYWNAGNLGDAMAAAIVQGLSYSGRVQYYQYDEFSEKANGRMVADFILYDVIDKKIVGKERVEVQVQDAVVWAENPMAVGVLNKIPATVYPPEIASLMNRKRPLKSDDELKTDLSARLTDEIIGKVRLVIRSANDVGIEAEPRTTIMTAALKNRVVITVYKDIYGMDLPDSSNPDAAYSSLIESASLYDLICSKKNCGNLPEEAYVLVEETRSYRNREFVSLSRQQKDSITKLNENLLQAVYAQLF